MTRLSFCMLHLTSYTQYMYIDEDSFILTPSYPEEKRLL